MAKITLSGIVGWDITAGDFKKEISAIKDTDDLEIEINTPGGSVFEGIEISNAIKNHKGHTTTIATSLTASMGSYLMMAGDTKKAFDDATFMIHNASSIEWGDHRAMRKTANVLESLTNMLSKAYVNQTGQSKTEVRDLMDDETWLFGDEILNAGFVDEIIKTEKPEDKEDAVAYQKLVFQDSIKKMQADKKENEVDKLAAYFNENKINAGVALTASADQTPETGKEPGNAPAITAQNEENMTLAEFLKANPTAQTEIDQMVAEGVTASETKAKDLFAKVSPIISSSAYPDTVKKIGMKVLSGDRPLWALTDRVEELDAEAEARNTAEIVEEQPEPTASEQHDLDAADEVKTTAEANAIGQKFGTAKQEK